MNIFRVPWHKNNAFRHKIVPIFIPFAGCVQRCIFCAQDIQSGKNIFFTNEDIQTYLEQTKQELINRKKKHKPPVELAFYGGTFTALPHEHFNQCINFTKEMTQQGLCTGARCSTRPDAIVGSHEQRLVHMRKAGFKCIELGVQSFDNTALYLSKRHYDKHCVLEAAVHIKAQGFTLGVQLMPGMPGVTEEIFAQDVQQSLSINANFLRFYPCQVIEGTELALLWKQGKYAVWSLEKCIEALSEAWLLAHKAHIPVIRMGLAPEVDLEKHILAGPSHAALGNIVQATALFKYITSFIHDEQQVLQLTLPSFTQGYFWGHTQTMRKNWANYGIDENVVSWHSLEYIELTLEC